MIRTWAIVVVAAVVALVPMLAAPAVVQAADPWTREVRFAAEETPGDQRNRIVFSAASGDCTPQSVYPHWSDAAPTGDGTHERVEQAWLDAHGEHGGASLTPYGYLSSPWFGCWRGNSVWRTWLARVQEVEWPASGETATALTPVEGGTVRAYGNVLSGSATVGGELTFEFYASREASAFATESITVFGPNSGHASNAFDTEVDVPAGTRLYTVSGTGTAILRDLTVVEYGEGVSTEGGCQGTPGPGSDDGLVIPASGLSHISDHDEWGDIWLASGACLFLQDGHFRYYPPEGIDAGETMWAGIDAWYSGAVVTNPTGCTVVVQLAGGSAPVNILNTSTHSAVPTEGFQSVFTQFANAPEGARYFDIIISHGCAVGAIGLGNVEGDPVLDNIDGPTPGDGFGNDPWGGCTPGQDFMAVGEWVAYAACILTGIPGAVVGLLVGMLQTLFVPRSLGSRFERFIDLAETRVPFGWFAQVSGTIDGSLGASAAPIALVFNMGGLGSWDLAEPLSGAMGTLAPYRGILTALVVAGMLLGCLRWIMASVGVSPSHSEGES